MNSDRFSRLEERIEQLVEGSFARLFNDRLQPREVAVRLARAVEDNIRELGDGSLIAPNLFVVCLHEDDYATLQQNIPNVAQHLAETITDFANRTGLRLMSLPTVELCQNEAVTPRHVLITASHDEPANSTQVMDQFVPPPAPPPHIRPQLVIQGRASVPLNRSVMNIGRKRDNHIVVDDPRISRSHAQIRLRFGRYVLYDLGSKAGTFVNGQRITEVILQPGDVISMAGVRMVYMEDDDAEYEGKSAAGDTQMRSQLNQSNDGNEPPDSPDSKPTT
jgi:ribosomal protein S15P/S13E